MKRSHPLLGDLPYKKYMIRYKILQKENIAFDKAYNKKQREHTWNIPSTKLYDAKYKYTRNPNKYVLVNYDKTHLYKPKINKYSHLINSNSNTSNNIINSHIDYTVDKIHKRLLSETSLRTHSPMLSLCNSSNNNNKAVTLNTYTTLSTKHKHVKQLSPSLTMMSSYSTKSNTNRAVNGNVNVLKKNKVSDSTYKKCNSKVVNKPLYTTNVSYFIKEMERIKSSIANERKRYKKNGVISEECVDKVMNVRKDMKMLKLRMKYLNTKFPEKKEEEVHKESRMRKILEDNIDKLDVLMLVLYKKELDNEKKKE